MFFFIKILKSTKKFQFAQFLSFIIFHFYLPEIGAQVSNLLKNCEGVPRPFHFNSFGKKNTKSQKHFGNQRVAGGGFKVLPWCWFVPVPSSFRPVLSPKKEKCWKIFLKNPKLTKKRRFHGPPHSSAASYVVLRLLKRGEIENRELNIFQSKFVLPEHDGSVFAGDS